MSDPSSGTGQRLFLIWMKAPRYPLWSIPESSVHMVRHALGSGWRVESLDEPLHASGDGISEVPRAVLDRISEAEVFCSFGIPAPLLRAARQLRWVHSGAAGVGASLHATMRESDVLFTNSAGIHAEPMAEHALAMILHFARGMDIAAAGQRARDWRHAEMASEPIVTGEIAGKVVGIVGYGGIGRAVGSRCAALGMRVRAIRRTRGALPPEVEWIGTPDRLGDLLRSSDFLVVAVPETPATSQLIGRQEIAEMKPGAVLVNVARGGIVDEVALTEALVERRLRGAGLDVFGREPLSSDNPLWELDNALITPHVGGNSPEFWRRETDLIVRNIARFLSGDPLENLVDKELGY